MNKNDFDLKQTYVICYYSDDLFNGYQIVIETEKLNLEPSLLKESIINYCYNDLYDHLKKFKLNELELKLREKKNLFHIHEDVDILNLHNRPIYVCSHVNV
jgi:hypothetical protein